MVDIITRAFQKEDAAEVSALITKTLRITNSKDYSPEYIEKDVAQFTPEKVIERASWTHFYVFCDGEIIVGCGAIGPYWGSETESSLFNIFVLPEYQGKGIGTQAMKFVTSHYDDWEQFTLITPVDKEENVRFYTQRCGFSIVSTEMDGNVKVARFVLERGNQNV